MRSLNYSVVFAFLSAVLSSCDHSPDTSALLLQQETLRALCPDLPSKKWRVDGPKVSRRGWNRSINALISRGKPFHFIWDGFASETEPGILEAKFDYGKLVHKDLEGEAIAVFLRSTRMPTWKNIGEYITDHDGRIRVEVPSLPPGDYLVKMIVLGDLTYAIGTLSVVAKDAEVIVFDLDGTLTRSDLEVAKDYLGVGGAVSYPGAKEMVEEYSKRAYRIIFLTARPYFLGKITRNWLRAKGYPMGHLYFPKDVKTSMKKEYHDDYKVAYLRDLSDRLGVKIVRAYGNAKTDVWAYRGAGVGGEDIYTIGENAGFDGSQPIGETGYNDHIKQVVKPTHQANCQ